MAQEKEARSISFFIPSVPESVNSLYQVFFHTKQVKLKPELLIWKSEAKQWMPPLPFKIGAEDCMSLAIECVTGWKYKNGKWKKQDVSNMIKLIEDSVAEKYGYCDSQNFEVKITKVHDDTKNRVNVRLERYEPKTTAGPS